eukprot:gi/632959942/ref/XP_007895909.1/ PREDICTED: uncharacterized protein LOC103181315 isoform X2 [Callorhinchus milii]
MRRELRGMEFQRMRAEKLKAIDAVYFSAANENGCYLVGAIARRPAKMINGFLYIKLPETGLLLSPRLPDTLMSTHEEAFGAEGLLFQPVEAMRKWKLTYDGAMRLDKGDQLVHVCMNLDWESKLDYFDFDTDMHSIALAKAIAREQWSKEFFKKLEDLHQTHHEQFGKITGTIQIDGFGCHKVTLDSMRDHSFGDHRDWKYFHRYGFHMGTLNDGTSFNIGIVSQSNLLTVLELGYLYTPSGEKHPVKWCGLDLACHGEGGTPPLDYGFEFEAGGKRYFLQCQILASPEFYIGMEWEARIVERLATYTVNGVKGWGISEWHYRHHGGRPEKYANRK